jgi:hypothetical protein
MKPTDIMATIASNAPNIQGPPGSTLNDEDALLCQVASADVDALANARKHYGDSWKKRGGVGAFMMLARKWDRLENRLTNPGQAFGQYDIFRAIETDSRAEGIIDDIRDLRRYLMLVEAEMLRRGNGRAEVAKG